jgi:prepilin-type N-terminal cleavage/methylation domain-containing protein
MKRVTRVPAGFTLIEMLLAIGIFVFLVSGVYVVVSVAVSASTALGSDQIESRRISAFQNFLRRGFLNLPAEAEITLGARSRSSLGDGLELVIHPSAGAFDISSASGEGSGVVFGTMPDGKGKYRFSMARFPARMGQDEMTKYLETAPWLPMLEQVESIRWRFWDKNLNRFVETWDQGHTHPELIEFSFTTTGEPPITCLFRLPSLSPSTNQP